MLRLDFAKKTQFHASVSCRRGKKGRNETLADVKKFRNAFFYSMLNTSD